MCSIFWNAKKFQSSYSLWKKDMKNRRWIHLNFHKFPYRTNSNIPQNSPPRRGATWTFLVNTMEAQSLSSKIHLKRKQRSTEEEEAKKERKENCRRTKKIFALNIYNLYSKLFGTYFLCDDKQYWGDAQDMEKKKIIHRALKGWKAIAEDRKVFAVI